MDSRINESIETPKSYELIVSLRTPLKVPSTEELAGILCPQDAENVRWCYMRYIRDLSEKARRIN